MVALIFFLAISSREPQTAPQVISVSFAVMPLIILLSHLLLSQVSRSLIDDPL